jgi:sec-independent protein translocase protein TatB
VFDVSGAELIALLLLALFVFGPERLPKVAADAARALRQLRTLIAGAKEDVRRELGPELEGIDLSDLNPRSFVRRNLLENPDLGLDDLDRAFDDDGPTRRDDRSGRRGGAASRTDPGSTSAANGQRRSGVRERTTAAGERTTAAGERTSSAGERAAESSGRGSSTPFDADAT